MFKATITAFVLFIVLVWLANTLGVALADVLAGKVPAQLLGVLDPHRTPHQTPTVTGDTPSL